MQTIHFWIAEKQLKLKKQRKVLSYFKLAFFKLFPVLVQDSDVENVLEKRGHFRIFLNRILLSAEISNYLCKRKGIVAI